LLIPSEESQAIVISHKGPVDAAIMMAKKSLGCKDDTLGSCKDGEGVILTYEREVTGSLHLVKLEEVSEATPCEQTGPAQV